MSMKNKDEKLEIIKEQLLPEEGFIRFCNEGPANTDTGGRMEIYEQFLRAAKKDELLKPLFQNKGKVKQNDGTEKDGLVNYYSPHQIYLLAELRGNSINPNGYLYNPNAGTVIVKGQKEKPRYVQWGQGMSFEVNYSQKRARENDDLMIDIHLITDYLHNFLELLHSLEPVSRYHIAEEKQRYWSNASILEYDFEPLKSGGKKLLKLYDLDERKLIILRKNIGQFAEVIDPLAHWHYYIKKHPEWKKDLLKGDASLAQEIYRLYYLLTEAWEVITKKKSEPIFEFIRQGFPRSPYPYGKPHTEYVHGEDIKALQYAIQQFKKWKRLKANKPFVSDGVVKKIEEIEKQLADYEKRYGDRSYAGSYREIEPEKNLKIDDLDEKTKRYVRSVLKQSEDGEEDRVKNEISMAIMHRLGDLKRELQGIFWDISKQFSDKGSAAWQRERNFYNTWWVENREKLNELSREEQLKLSSAERRKIVKEAKGWEERGSAFHQSVSWYVDVVFCKACKEKPVRQHLENTTNMLQVSNEAICDDCFNDIGKKALDINLEEWSKIKEGEWACSCLKTTAKGKELHPTLYKFAHRNAVSLWTKGDVPIKIEVVYGKILLEAKCPNCGEKSQKPLDWGWKP